MTRRIVRLWMVAATLLSVTTRGREMMRPWPFCSSAVRRTSSDWAPLSEPSARSSALPEPATTLLAREVDQERHAAGAAAEAGAAEADGAGEVRAGAGAGLRADVGAVAPLHAELAGEVGGRLDDVRLDQHLRDLHVEAADQIAGVARCRGRCRARSGCW